MKAVAMQSTSLLQQRAFQQQAPVGSIMKIPGHIFSHHGPTRLCGGHCCNSCNKRTQKLLVIL